MPGISRGEFIFNVAVLVREVPGASRSCDVRADPEHLDVPELAGPVTGQALLLRLPDGVHVTGEFSAPVCQACARCLDPADAVVTFAANDEFGFGDRPSLDPVDGSDWLLDERHNLDLAPLLAEGVIAALPLMPVCRSACRGLAPANKVQVEGFDPRLRRLAELRDRMFSNSPRSRS